MKKLLSIVLCLLMALSVLPAGAENPSVLDKLWNMADFSFLADMGILTGEEAALLALDRDVVESGRELVREFTLAVGPLTGVPEEDALLNELLSRVTFINRSQRHEEALEVLLDGETLLTLGYGEGEEGYRISSNLLDEVIAFTAADLEKLPKGLDIAALAYGLITQTDPYQTGVMTAGWTDSIYAALLTLLSSDMSVYNDLDFTAWNAALAPVQGRQLYTAVAEQPADCDAAVEMWTLTVTGADVTNLVRAALITLRDNPDLTLALSEALGLEDMGYLYDMRGNVLLEEVVNPILAELEGVEELLPVELQLTAWENEAGEIVRMEIVVLDTTPDYQLIKTAGYRDGIMSNHGIHGVQDMCNLLKRNRKPYYICAGHALHSDVVTEVSGMCRAAAVKKAFQRARIGSVGGSFHIGDRRVGKCQRLFDQDVFHTGIDRGKHVFLACGSVS